MARDLQLTPAPWQTACALSKPQILPPPPVFLTSPQTLPPKGKGCPSRGPHIPAGVGRHGRAERAMSDRRGGSAASSTRSIRARSRTATATASATCAGIRRRLDYLHWLGVDAIWISPIYPSPMADFGYDVADYCDVDPLFGTLADFDALVADAHARGMKVILDFVPNHTSDQHPWFAESRASRDNPKRDWYIWRDPAPGRRAAQQLARQLRRPRLDVRRGDRPVLLPRLPAASSPTSTGATPRCARRCTTCCASGSTAASTASAST